jgi:hypothetical protein
VATLGRLVPQLRGQECTEDERETVRRQIGRVRAAADWLEGALHAHNAYAQRIPIACRRSAQKAGVDRSVSRL